MKIFLIRHGKTPGNIQRRYVGRTDEVLSGQGMEELRGIRMLAVDMVYVSPLKRCRQTAAILYPGHPVQIVPGLRECDFGAFEYKNYEELKNDRDYQKWMDSRGTLPFPGGEDSKKFRGRCAQAAREVITKSIREGCASIALVVHGGTIMSILEAYSWPKKEFYCWQAENKSGYLCEIEDALWIEGVCRMAVRRIP